MITLNTNQDIDACHISPKEFFDFRATLNKYYRSLRPGETQNSHVFTISKDRGATVIYKEDIAGGTEIMDNLLPTKQNKTAEFMPPAEREPKIKALLDKLKSIPPPGIQAQKQVELYVKWRPVLHNKSLCPKPDQSILDAHKKSINQKARDRTARERAEKIANKKKEAEKTSDKEPSPTPQSLV